MYMIVLNVCDVASSYRSLMVVPAFSNFLVERVVVVVVETSIFPVSRVERFHSERSDQFVFQHVQS